MGRLIIKNVNYNKYHEIFSFISRHNFKHYRKKDILINPREYKYYSVNTFNNKKYVNIEIDDTYDNLIKFLHIFSDKYAYNKSKTRTYINRVQIHRRNKHNKKIIEYYSWL